ncbi:hypothetical protein AVEN_222935-1, partial [Araneus ventricosus]
RGNAPLRRTKSAQSNASVKMATVKQKARLWFHESSPIVIVQRIIRLEYRNCQSSSKNFIKRQYEKVKGTGNVHQ